MKKIVTVAAIAAMAAGMASADVAININSRIRMNAAAFGLSGDTDFYGNQTNYFELDNTVGSKAANGASDTIKFAAKNDYAGVTLAYNNDLSKGTIGFDSYSGYLKFGNLTFTSGYFDSRSANRVTTDQNNNSLLEGNWIGKVYELDMSDADPAKWAYKYNDVMNSGKLGINKKTGVLGKIGQDVDNITAYKGSKGLAFVADYVFADVAGGKLQVWGALNRANTAWSTTDDDGNVTNVNSGYAFRAAYKNDVAQVVADAQLYGHHQAAYALFFSPLSVDGLAATAGFTYAKDHDDSAIAVDARARYAINDASAATLYVNYTKVMTDADAKDDDAVLDVIANFTYTANDMFKPFAEAEVVYFMYEDSDAADLIGNMQLVLQAGTVITAGKGATLTPAVRFSKSGIGHDSDLDPAFGSLITIPVTMRIQL